jgi:arginyl-tRNA synthetase
VTESVSGILARKVVNRRRSAFSRKRLLFDKRMDFRKEIEKAVVGQVKKLYQAELSPSLERPVHEDFGDYASAVAFQLSSRGKGNPLEIAGELAEALSGCELPLLQSVEAVKPGFINFRLSTEALLGSLQEVISSKKNFGKSQSLKGQKMMVEYAHPNTHKELHIGHMRTLITGEALARIFQFCGAAVFRANYQGDIGPHVAKSLWGTEKLVRERKLSWGKLEKAPLVERARLLGEGYVRGNQDYLKHKKELDLLNKKLYEKDPEVMPLYQRTRTWSLEYYDAFYRLFGTKFDRLYFESEIAQHGKEIVEANVGKVFEESEGALIFDGEKHGLHKRVFVTSSGNPTYEAKDMGLAQAQYADFPFDKNIHVVANEQKAYFEVVFKALELLDRRFSDKMYHLPMGMVSLVGKELSSRKGVVITVDGLIKEVKKLTSSLIKQSKTLAGSRSDDLVEVVSLAAIKWSVLKTAPTLNAAFDPKESVKLRGDSGPYLQYTGARCFSVLRKSALSKGQIRFDKYRPTPEEAALLRWLIRFPEAVSVAARQYSPNTLCAFLFELAQRYNRFYDSHRIIDAKDSGEKSFRLAVTKATSQVIENGLFLLGIAAPQKM